MAANIAAIPLIDRIIELLQEFKLRFEQRKIIDESEQAICRRLCEELDREIEKIAI